VLATDDEIQANVRRRELGGLSVQTKQGERSNNGAN
jgi:hypothetical protein